MSAEALRRLVGAAAIEAEGWATVDLDRAESEMRSRAAGRSLDVRDAADDPLLGARVRLVGDEGDAGPAVLLEPATEGRLAASLARFGEGVAVRWILVPVGLFDDVVAAAAGQGIALSGEAHGPFGRERLLVGSEPWGPHVLLAQRRA